MTEPTILLVEDNPITRKLVRFTLQSKGYRVLDAPDGQSALSTLQQHHVDLILQDLQLPDIDGFELVGRLRALPNGAEIPILAFSGFVSKLEEARLSAVGFDDVLTKPIEPSRLLHVIRTHLPAALGPSSGFGKGRHLLVADDDPVQRKLVCYRLGRMGFRTTPAADGEEALDAARREPPDAIIADVMMPRLDGFALCVAVRNDPRLRALPLYLVTNSYLEHADRELAANAGANGMMQRTPELADLALALQGVFDAAPAQPPPVPRLDLTQLEAERTRRVVSQLERQVTLNAGVSQRAAMLGAELSVLSGISGALAQHQDMESALRDVLAACLDAGGISVGALYLATPQGFRVHKLGGRKEWSADVVDGFFGEPELLHSIMAGRRPAALPSAEFAGEAASRFLANSGVTAALVIPLEHKADLLGALLMVSSTTDLNDADRIAFATGVANQISLALALTTAFSQKAVSEQQANERAAVLRSVLESMADGVVVVDATGAVLLSNRGAEWLEDAGPLPTSPAAWSAHFGLLLPDQSSPFPPDQLPLVRALRGEVVDAVEMCMTRAPAQPVTWLSVTARPLIEAASGKVTGAAAVFRDVTVERGTQAQLLVSDRMASVGTLAAGVAHEINNPLASVLANLDLAMLELEELAPLVGTAVELSSLREELRDAREGAERVRHIVRDLKLFSRSEDERLEPVEVRRVLESSLRMAWNEIRHRATLVKNYSEVPLVNANEARLGQVFLNLIVNAAQSIGEGRANENELRITTRMAGNRVVVDVADTGSGIPPELMGRLFTPFFTTKPAGVGTGLGLSICHRLVSAMGGELTVESAIGKGTVFHVALPAAAAHGTATVAAPEQTASPQGRRGRVLVVDDEARICSVISRVLGVHHDVVCFTDSRQALRQILDGPPADVILCDLMMPIMTGMDLYAQLQQARPDHAGRMVFLTGGAFTQGGRVFLDDVKNPRVEKPFDLAELRRLVADLVG